MALLNSLRTEPPDGWRYLQRETGVWIRAELCDELVAQVIAHRQHKGLAPTDTQSVLLEIQRQLCLGAPKGVCKPEKGEDYIPLKDEARKLDLKTIAGASEALVFWLKSGLGMVSKERAKERADICRSCQFNRPVPNCVCTPFWKIIDALIPKDRREPGLSVCGLCKCSLAAKVLAPSSVVREGMPSDLRLPPWCWVAKES